MNKWMILALTAFQCLTLPATAAVISATMQYSNHPTQTTPLIKAEQITDALLLQFSNGKMESIVIEFSEGSRFPLAIFLKGDLIAFNSGETSSMSLTCLRHFYVYLSADNILFSLDKMEWKPFMEFTTGNITAMCNAQNGIPAITLGADLTVRN